MKRLTTSGEYPHGAEGTSLDNLTGSWYRGSFEATACVEKLSRYEDTGLEPEEVLRTRNIAMVHLKESLKENDRAIRKARILGQDATEIRQASAEMERFLLLLSTGLNI